MEQLNCAPQGYGELQSTYKALRAQVALKRAVAALIAYTLRLVRIEARDSRVSDSGRIGRRHRCRGRLGRCNRYGRRGAGGGEVEKQQSD